MIDRSSPEPSVQKPSLRFPMDSRPPFEELVPSCQRIALGHESVDESDPCADWLNPIRIVTLSWLSEILRPPSACLFDLAEKDVGVSDPLDVVIIIERSVRSSPGHRPQASPPWRKDSPSSTTARTILRSSISPLVAATAQERRLADRVQRTSRLEGHGGAERRPRGRLRPFVLDTSA